MITKTCLSMSAFVNAKVHIKIYSIIFLSIFNYKDNFIEMVNKMGLHNKFEKHLFVTISDAVFYLQNLETIF